ncbi:WD40-repeat-containing domain protein [Dimargaris cristalligena]|uniref:WD40-repeat-containing domain protein n=1 Tax=Dimargaris cristalligena TaxID=215637 RepID=A0A4V1J5I8_9FUNG|nr:WD40-repeat-containing domain protein [Dimargaris cristalligena]|eukprot:RKP39209.1 WD40-repeat-containing domain protein [Dimargaris cristalligena]
MEGRQEEIARKRQRLAEIRRQREERRQAFLGGRPGPAATGPAPATNGRQEIDDLVASLVGERLSPRSPTRIRASSISQTLSEPGLSFQGNISGSSSTTDLTSIEQRAMSPTGFEGPPKPQAIPEFSAFDAVILDMPPKERLAYNKEAQTTDMLLDPPVIPEEEIERRVKEQREKDEKARRIAEEQEKKRQEELQKQRQKLKELTEDEKMSIEQSSEFTDFIDYSSKLVERALNETYDFMTDYTISQQVDGDQVSGDQIKLYCNFSDERWTKNRSVTDVAWSKKFPELVVSSYNRNPMAMNDPDGIVCVWNLHLRERPEFVFHSQSDILQVRFSDFHPNLVIGGTYSGQILLWDTRAKAQPVLKTPLSAVGHTHPVYSLDMVGTQNAHNLVTASTDGVVCSWQLDILAKPQEILELTPPPPPRTDEVAPTAMGFPEGETAAFWVGTEEGNVYQANRYDRAGSKAGLNLQDVYRGHTGPVTGLNFHPLVGPVDYTDLFLTCSVDWTVKLWRAKSPNKSTAQASSGGGIPSSASGMVSSSSSLPASAQTTPIHSFEAFDDYIYDVKWSPIHPAIFGTVDGSGHFDVWNLNTDTEVPVLSTPVGSGKHALNRLAWDKFGRKAAIGTIDSTLAIYELGDWVVPKSHDFTHFQKTVQDLTMAQNLNLGNRSYD